MEKGFLNSTSASKCSKAVGRAGFLSSNITSAQGSTITRADNKGSYATLANQRSHINKDLTSLADQTRTGGSQDVGATKSDDPRASGKIYVDVDGLAARMQRLKGMDTIFTETTGIDTSSSVKHIKPATNEPTLDANLPQGDGVHVALKAGRSSPYNIQVPSHNNEFTSSGVLNGECSNQEKPVSFDASSAPKCVEEPIAQPNTGPSNLLPDLVYMYPPPSTGNEGVVKKTNVESPKSTVNEPISDKGPVQNVTRSFANVVTPECVIRKVNFRPFVNETHIDNHDTVLPKAAMEGVLNRYDNNLVGFFVGKNIAFPLVQNYVTNTWGKFGLKKLMKNDDGVFLFKFDSKEGVEKVLQRGPWIIRNSPIILTKWTPDIPLTKSEVTKVPVWIKLHNVPLLAYSEDGLSLIATKVWIKKTLSCGEIRPPPFILFSGQKSITNRPLYPSPRVCNTIWG